MRRLLLAAAVLVALPAALPAPALAAPANKPLPHTVGGYVPAAGRTVPKVRALDVLPDSVDLRADAPAPGDQGQIGACVAWTVGYSIMGYWAKHTGGAGAPYAPLFLYMRNVAKGGAPSAGLVPDYVLANAQSAGIDTQDDYWQGTTNWQDAPSQAQIDNAKNYRVSGWTRLFNGANQGAGAQAAVMQSLASGNPVALGIPVFRDFMYLRQHSLYTTTTGTNLGGHMIAVYGYDAQGVYIRNSWGTGWGNGGDAKLSWAFVTKAATGAYAVSGVTTPAQPTVPMPSVAALSTTKAPAGTSVTITGSSLASVTSVKFGGTEATFQPLVANGVTKLVATAPAHATGLVDVTVTNAAGTSAAVKTSKFTYVPPAPGITRLDPATVTVLGGQPVTLAGSDLAGVTSVKVGTVTAPATKVTATSLTFAAPVRPAGTYPVTVTNAWGTSNPAGQLTYVLPPAPVITTVTPASGLTYKSTAVTLTGTDFAGATKMTLDGRTVGFTKVSPTQLKLTLPAHAAGDGALQVTTPGGTSTAGTFTWTAPPVPVVTDIAPAGGLTYVRTPVVVTGTGFTDSTKVTLAGVTVPYTKVSDTQLKLTLPTRAAGPADLRITTPGGTSAAGTPFTYEAPPVPEITGLSVTTASTKSATTVTVTGTGLTGASKVLVGTASVGFTKLSDTQLRVTIPPRAATTTTIAVVTPGGTSAGVPLTFA
ncbi:IPT/TIG domain-containing protein [Actinoplanes sp. RD1]|uniref:IPT/TIG domain-containing protein n=1 Tax=Actinoplanes sp. RD1 TaxID=3064538 RepID=UPI00274271DC|nr:IPT/TIG domain-containing protein [Actinoplanes sp. RD1]